MNLAYYKDVVFGLFTIMEFSGIYMNEHRLMSDNDSKEKVHKTAI